jgi:Tol biopolymer transport system component
MGVVYRARDTTLDRDVALKLLPQAFAHDPERLARFDREAKTLAALNHTNIAHIYGVEDGVDHAGGTLRALVMELVEGPTLADRLVEASSSRGPSGLPNEEVLAIARQLADALEAAHELGIVHRDLKPANIKVRPDGTVKVLDFGLAKLVSSDDRSVRPDLTKSPTLTSPALMTGAGVILGTAAYMAPEQARGKAVDKRADIWAFGCVVYELLTGRRAFGGDEVPDTMVAVLSHEPDWTALPPGAALLEPLLRRCLVKDPRKRLRDIGEARLALDALGDGTASTSASAAVVATTARVSFRQILPWIAASVVATSLIAVGAWGSLRPNNAEPTEFRATILPPEGTRPAMAFGAQLFALSPDGRHIAFVRLDSDGQRHLWVRETNSLSARPLRGTEGAMAPFWSPDSQSIGFATDGRLQRVEITGGLPVQICALKASAMNVSAGTWAPDGTVLFAALITRVVFRVPASGGQPTEVTRLDEARGETAHSQPSFLPDGRHFLYYAGTQGQPLGLYVGSLDSSDRVRVLERGSRARYAAGHLFYTRDRELVAQPFDLRTFTLHGEAVSLAEDVDVGGATGASGAFSVSTAGAVLYQARGVESSVRLEWFDREGTSAGTLGDAGNYAWPEVSPDGVRTGIRLFSGDPGNLTDLWVFDNASGIRRQLTSGQTNELSPLWSPDGKRVAFGVAQPAVGTNAIRVQALAATEDIALYEGPFFMTPTSWSRDDRFLLFTTRSGGGARTDIMSLPLMGDRKPQPYRASASAEEGGVFSPDGRWVAYFSDESGRNEIYVAPFPDPTDARRVTPTGGAWPQWRNDGRELYYLSLDGTLTAIDVMPQSARLTFGTPHALFKTTTQGGERPYSPAPGGQRFLVATSIGNPAPAPLTLLVRRW